MPESLKPIEPNEVVTLFYNGQGVMIPKWIADKYGLKFDIPNARTFWKVIRESAADGLARIAIAKAQEKTRNRNV